MALELGSKNQFDVLDEEFQKSLEIKNEKIKIMMPPKRVPLKAFPTLKSVSSEKSSFPSLISPSSSSSSSSSNPITPLASSPSTISYAEKLRKMAETEKEIAQKLEEQKKKELVEKQTNIIYASQVPQFNSSKTYTSSLHYDNKYSNEDDENYDENTENEYYGSKPYEEYCDDHDTCKPFDGTEYLEDDS
jgi:hypothetical protein